MATLNIVSMTLFPDSVNIDTATGLNNRVPPLLAIRWALQTIDGSDDVKSFLHTELTRELLPRVKSDIGGNVTSVTAFTNWHSTGGMHTSGAVLVKGDIPNNPSKPWRFTENNKSADVFAVASYWEATV